MEPKSKMTIRVLINVEHDGETTDINQTQVMNALKQAMKELLEEDDDGLEPYVSCYVSEFQYRDNIETLRSKAKELIDILDSDTIQDLLSELRSQNE